MLPWRAHLAVWAIVALIVVLLLVLARLYDGANVWRGLEEARGFRQPTYAERIQQAALFRTRANTWSNLAYVVVGLYVCAGALADRRLRPAEGSAGVPEPVLSGVFGVTCVYLGIGSGVFHASLTRWGQQLDVAAMYAPLLAGLALQAGRLFAVHRPGWTAWPWLAGLVVAAEGLLYRFKWSMSSTWVLGTLILLQTVGVVADLLRPRGQVRPGWAVASLAALLAAIACRQLDVAGRFSGPDAWLQGHACWHALTALSLACLYGHQRSAASGAYTPNPPR